MEHERQSRKSRHQRCVEHESPLPCFDELVNEGPSNWKLLADRFFRRAVFDSNTRIYFHEIEITSVIDQTSYHSWIFVAGLRDRKAFPHFLP
jgi:hypothetical protein